MLNLNRRKRLVDYIRHHSKDAAIFLTSKWSFVVVILLLSLYFIFPIDRTIYAATPVLGWNDNYYLTLWQVYGAIVGLSFVALFFSYEAFFSRVTSNFKNLEFRFRREFYQKTFVQPLLFFNLFSLVYVGIIINTSQAFQSLTLLILSITSICLLFAKAISFFESDEMEKTRSRILQTEIVDSIDAELDRRLSTNLLLRVSEKHENIKFELFTLEEKNRKLIQLSVTERERISDIAIDKIVSIIKPRKIYLKKAIGDIVSPQYSIVGAVPAEINDNSIRRLKNCFKLKSEPVRKDLHLSLDDIAQQLQNAVNSANIKDLERSLELYYRSLEKFLRTLQLYGISYSPEQAKQGEILHEWEPIFIIQHDFFHLIENSVEKGNKEIIRAEVNFIRDILTLANENDDYLIFNRFRNFWATTYCIALELESKSHRNAIIEMVINTISEFTATQLLLHLAHSEMTKKQIEKYREYSIDLILLFEQILKASLDTCSLESFKRVQNSLDLILTNYEPESNRPYAVEIEATLMNPSLSSQERKKLSEQVEIARAKNQLKLDLDNLLLEVWFGIGGWISQLYLESKYSETQTADFLKVVLSHFKNLQGLSSVYTGVDTLYPSFTHSWKWWDTRDTPPGIVISLSGNEQMVR
jgi:hypothetical protein